MIQRNVSICSLIYKADRSLNLTLGLSTIRAESFSLADYGYGHSEALNKPHRILVEMNTRRSKQGPDKLTFLADVKLGYRPDEVAFILGSVQLFDEMVAAKWLRPVVNRHKLLLYDRGDISRAWARIINGEEPPRRQRK